MKKTGTGILAALLIGACAALTAESATVPQDTTANTVPREHFVTLTMQSKALAKNITGDSAQRDVGVYLPPSYYDTDKRYPVVYYLHGYEETGLLFLYGNTDKLDELFKAGAKEFIVVAVDGRNTLGGSFYADSPVAGNWETYVTDEVVPLIDKSFRTLDSRDSRGLWGFSMGGYGAFNIAMKRPDMFGTCLTMSPGMIAEGDLPAAFATWNYTFKMAYARTFAPNKRNKDTLGDIPAFTGTSKDNAIVRKWEDGYGSLEKKINKYISLKKPLRAIKITYGELDSYPWIPRGCIAFSEILDKKGIKHTIESLPSGHWIPFDAFEAHVIPFFNENLDY